MRCRNVIAAAAVAGVLSLSPAAAQWPPDLSKYPDWSAQWYRVGPIGQYNPATPRDKQGAPLTPEYQKIFEAGIADEKLGGQGNDPTYTCLPDGMPRVMNGIFPMEIVVMPKMTYILVEYLMQMRRIYTDGRTMPEDAEPSFGGYSIGEWRDTDGDGRYDELRVETRNFRGPRVFDPTGIPLAKDNETVVRERFFIDKQNPDILHDEITTIDHALTEPWTVLKSYRRERNAIFSEAYCAVDNPHVKIGSENYMLDPHGVLMPTKKGQKPPDLRYFK
ncbi:MAG TPA: hypothetical protein VH684_13020 [Xanthobacteraceae bacterium]|jgi:hypothetical protein